MKLTRVDLAVILPLAGKRVDTYLGPINATADEFDIAAPLRLAAFIAQCGHETQQLIFRRELWGPTKAQLGYEGRVDLGNTVPGDGKRFMGRGLIQTTGRANYRRVSVALFGDARLLEFPELLEDPLIGTRASGFFWKSHGLNELADVGNLRLITRTINGGYTHYDRRLALYKTALAVLIPGEPNA